MPTWGMHLYTAKKLKTKFSDTFKNTYNEFYFGNLLPDIPNGFVIKNISCNISHTKTHFDQEVNIGNHKEKRSDINGFFQKYHSKFNNPLILGYYTHLLTDTYWNNKTYNEKAILDVNKNLIGINLQNGQKFMCNKEEIRRIKSNDFKLYAYKIFKNNLVDEIKYTPDIEKFLKEITWLKLEKADIIKTIEYIKEKIIKPESILESKNLEYQIYSEKEMEENIKNSIKFINCNL